MVKENVFKDKRNLIGFIIIILFMFIAIPRDVFSATSVIIKQPESITIKENTKATFTVEISGDNLTFTWLYKEPTDEFTWMEVTSEMATEITTNTLTIEKALMEYQGYAFRCLVEGEVVELSDIAYLYIENSVLNENVTVEDLTPPTDFVASSNLDSSVILTWTNTEEKQVTVESLNSSGEWIVLDSNAKSPYTIYDLEENTTYEYRICATNIYGSKSEYVYATAQTQYGAEKSIIQKQPETTSVPENTEATFTVEALGENLKYLWLYKESADEFTWKEVPSEIATEITTNTLTITNASMEYQGYAFRCLVEGATREISNIAYLYIQDEKLKNDVVVGEATPPADFVASSNLDSSVILTWVQPEQSEIILEVLNKNGEWIVLDNNAKVPYTIYDLEENTIYEYRICAVDKLGAKSKYVYTTGQTQYGAEKSIIQKQPETTSVPEITEATFTVEASGENLKYLWLYKESAEEFAWKEVPSEMATEITTNTLTITNASMEYQGYAFRCLVEGATREISNIAYLYIQDEKLKNDVVVGEATPPADFVASSNLDSSVILTWVQPEQSEIILEVLNKNGEWIVLDNNAKAPYTIYNLEENTIYEYRICAVDKLGAKSKYVYATAQTQYGKEESIILEQPETMTVQENTEATFTVEALGENLKYLWLYKESADEFTWKEVPSEIATEITTNTLTITSASMEYQGYAFRCLVEGETRELSNVAYLYVQDENLNEDVQVEAVIPPMNFVANSDIDLSMILTWENPVAENQIILEVKNSSDEWIVLDNNAKSPYTIYDLEENTTYEYRICAVDKLGAKSKYVYATAQTQYGKEESIILEQPETMTVQENTEAKFTVEALGESLKYLWLYKEPTEEFAWKEVQSEIATEITTNTLTITNASMEYQGYAFRCLVEGEIRELSNVAYLYIQDDSLSGSVIVGQLKAPTDFIASSNSDFSITLTWNNPNEEGQIVLEQLNENGEWIVLSNDANSPYRITETNGSFEFEFRIYAVDERGGRSEYVYASEQLPLIIKQPETITVQENVEAAFTVEANGNNLTYTWLYKEPTDEFTWKEVPSTMATGMTTNTLTITSASKEYQGYAFRCLVEGAKREISRIAYLYVKDDALNEDILLSGIADPKNFVASGDINCDMTLTFDNPNPENKIILEVLDSNNEWRVISDNAVSPFVINGLDENTTYDYRIHAVDMNGIRSEYVYATGYIPYVREPSIIIKQPETTSVLENTEAKFTVETSGENLKYTWLYKEPADEFTWKEVPSEIATGMTTNTLIITSASVEYQGYAFRCLVEGKERELSNIAYLLIIKSTQIVKASVKDITYYYEDGTEYDSNWTNQNVIAIVPIVAGEDVAIKTESGEWSGDPSYADVIKTDDSEIRIIFNTSINSNVYIKKVDSSGNTTKEYDVGKLIRIDKELPIIEDITYKTLEGILMLTAKVTDNNSGIEYNKITTEESVPVVWDSFDESLDFITRTLKTSGKYYLYLKDRAGNINSKSVMAIKDVEPPTGSIEIVAKNISQSGDKYTNQDEVIININVTDNETDTNNIMFALYNEADYEKVKNGEKEIEWKKYMPSVEFPLEEADGVNIIYAIFKDEAGNSTLRK